MIEICWHLYRLVELWTVAHTGFERERERERVAKREITKESQMNAAVHRTGNRERQLKSSKTSTNTSTVCSTELVDVDAKEGIRTFSNNYSIEKNRWESFSKKLSTRLTTAVSLQVILNARRKRDCLLPPSLNARNMSLVFDSIAYRFKPKSVRLNLREIPGVWDIHPKFRSFQKSKTS